MTVKTKRRILVVDDDPNTIKILEKWLVNNGCEVRSALNGRIGLQKAKGEFFDLILSDMMMPDVGGVEFARELKKDPSTADIPVIFITVTLGVEVDKGDETIDIDGVLYRIFAKPLHRQKLLTEVRKSINRRLHKNPFKIKGS